MSYIAQFVAWFRAKRCLARYRPLRIVIAGSYGRLLSLNMICGVMQSRQNTGIVDEIASEIDLPLRIIDACTSGESPASLIIDLPLLSPRFAPQAVCHIAPNMLVLTHVDAEHFDRFLNMETVKREYRMLIESLGSDATVIANADDENIRTMLPGIRQKTILCGTHKSCDVRLIRAVPKDGNGLFIEFVVGKKHYEAYMPNLFAQEHVSAMLCGIAGAYAQGIDIQKALDALRAVELPAGTFRKYIGLNGSAIFEESGDIRPDQLTQSLQSFAYICGEKRKILVLGDMDGLGEFSDSLHEEIGRTAVSIAPFILFVGKAMRHARHSAMKVGGTIDTHHFETSAEAMRWLPEHVRRGDCIYIAGDMRMEMQKITERLKEVDNS